MKFIRIVHNFIFISRSYMLCEKQMQDPAKCKNIQISKFITFNNMTVFIILNTCSSDI